MRRRRELIAVLALASAACGGDRFLTATDGGVADAATDGALNDGAAPADAAGDAALGPRISCGPSTCKIADTCCVYVGVGAPQYECHSTCPQPQSGASLSQLKCSSTADCASGQVCCIQRSSSQNASVCSSACTGNQVQLCDPSAQDPGCQGSTCSSNNIADWKLPNAFGTCGGLPVP